MNEKLEKGTRIKTLLNGEAVVERWLAEGGQGDVYIVKYNGEEKALKWYKPSGMGSDKQKFYKNLKDNVMKGRPSPEFLWPLDITEWMDDVFGYIMDLRPEGYHEVSDFMLTRVRFSSYRMAVDAALNIVLAYQILHDKGYSYQDLNDGNFFIHPGTGKVLICDNDNVAPEGMETGIIGKPRYMAPEIVMRKNMPNTYSDIFSMSVILFILFTLNHPLEGKRSLVPAMTPVVQEKLYGTKALFLMDEDNRENAPDPLIHKNVIMVWKRLPDYMQELFSRAFSQLALTNPFRRPVEEDWIRSLVRFRSDIVPCSCGNEVFLQQGKTCQCEKCGKNIRIPYSLKIRNYRVPAVPGNIIYTCQVASCNFQNALLPIAQVIAKGNDASVLGLGNVGTQCWDVEAPDGRTVTIKPKGAIPLKSGISLRIRADKAQPVEIVEN
ncbi:MAG: hypothetical protein NC548_47990 [Lachnospiraceae bacterium]|nr:hypothetical protein [Lachnospiraceae bacterium]